MPDIHISRIDPHPANIRGHLGDLTEITASIRVHGILQPVVVTEQAGRYQLLAGHRRLAAARLARLEVVPAIIRAAPQGAQSARAIEVMLVENCQRSDLSTIEKAEAMGALRNHGLNAATISRRTGLAPSTVSYYLSLLDLDEETRARVAAGTVQVRSAVKAVRSNRKANGGRSGRPVQAEPAWLTSRHQLASAAAAMCSHTRRPQVGDVACGQCWEQAIRDDHDHPLIDEPEPLSPRQERIEILAELRMLDGPDPAAAPGTVTARQAAELLGVTPRTVERYKRDLAEAGAS
jgi:ParB family chromosome partitioning protein